MLPLLLVFVGVGPSKRAHEPERQVRSLRQGDIRNLLSGIDESSLPRVDAHFPVEAEESAAAGDGAEAQVGLLPIRLSAPTTPLPSVLPSTSQAALPLLRSQPGTELLAPPALCSQPGVELLPMPPALLEPGAELLPLPAIREMGAELMPMPAIREPGAELLSMPAVREPEAEVVLLPAQLEPGVGLLSMPAPLELGVGLLSMPALLKPGAELLLLPAIRKTGAEAEVVLLPAPLELGAGLLLMPAVREKEAEVVTNLLAVGTEPVTEPLPALYGEAPTVAPSLPLPTPIMTATPVPLPNIRSLESALLEKEAQWRDLASEAMQVAAAAYYKQCDEVAKALTRVHDDVEAECAHALAICSDLQLEVTQFECDNAELRIAASEGKLAALEQQQQLETLSAQLTQVRFWVRVSPSPSPTNPITLTQTQTLTLT